MINFDTLFSLYNMDLTNESVRNEVEKVLAKHYTENNNVDVYKKCLNLIDLTTLNGDDTEQKVISMVNKVNDFEQHFPHLNNVAAICVYPAMVPVVKANLEEPIGIH